MSIRPQIKAAIKTHQISISKMERSCQEVSELLKALSHPQRLMIMGHLVQKPRAVSELQELCGISQSQLSQFLRRMRSEGLVTCERKGKYQYYAAIDDRIMKLMSALQNLYC
jgi:ArsR family transcriptional regulator